MNSTDIVPSMLDRRSHSRGKRSIAPRPHRGVSVYDRRDEREGRKHAQKGGAAIGIRRNDEAGLEDHPVDIAFPEAGIGNRLSAQELGRGLSALIT
jgi:hypothetical protein